MMRLERRAWYYHGRVRDDGMLPSLTPCFIPCTPSSHSRSRSCHCTLPRPAAQHPNHYSPFFSIRHPEPDCTYTAYPFVYPRHYVMSRPYLFLPIPLIHRSPLPCFALALAMFIISLVPILRMLSWLYLLHLTKTLVYIYECI